MGEELTFLWDVLPLHLFGKNPKKGPHSPCGVQYTKGLNNYGLIQK